MRMQRWCAAAITMVALLCHAATSAAQRADSLVIARGDSVVIRLVDVDLRAAVQSLAPYLDQPVVFGAATTGRVTLETPRPVPRAEVVRMLRGLLESHNLELLSDTVSGIYRVRAREVASRLTSGAAGGSQQGEAVQLFVIRLRHARAADVAASVNALYGRASAIGEIGVRPATLPQELRNNVVPPQGQVQTQLVSGTGSANLTGETTIVPDLGSNSLLIRANATDYALIQVAVRELDVRPLQALIEVMIAEVRKDRSLSFGVDATARKVDVPGTDKPGIATLQGLSAGDFALRVMGVGGVDIDATLRAAASRGDATILSRPIVIAANNEVAQILVGSQRPFVQVSRSLPTDAPQRDQVVQYKDVGTKLTVRPTISADGYVMLEVTQEVNAATAETQFDAPIISTRTLQTRLLIRDGQTAVIGGLSDHQRDRNQGGIPVLSSIPWLGGLFGRAVRRDTNTELYLFLKPTVLYTDGDIDRESAPYRQRAEKAEP